MSDAEYLRRYERDRARQVAEHAAGTSAGEQHLNDPRCWARIKDDAHGGCGGAWFAYAALLRTHRGLDLKAMRPDGTWRPWSPLELDPANS